MDEKQLAIYNDRDYVKLEMRVDYLEKQTERFEKDFKNEIHKLNENMKDLKRDNQSDLSKVSNDIKDLKRENSEDFKIVNKTLTLIQNTLLEDKVKQKTMVETLKNIGKVAAKCFAIISFIAGSLYALYLKYFIG